jgi:hypothetical protein
LSADAFAQLRAALSLPYEYDPYPKALRRAEQEAEATQDAAVTWLLACIRCNDARALTELLYWLSAASSARNRLQATQARKRSTLPLIPSR